MAQQSAADFFDPPNGYDPIRFPQPLNLQQIYKAGRGDIIDASGRIHLGENVVCSFPSFCLFYINRELERVLSDPPSP